jgi:peptidoglycan hydrolase-like protein with peptidoglycan-binding domain
MTCRASRVISLTLVGFTATMFILGTSSQFSTAATPTPKSTTPKAATSGSVSSKQTPASATSTSATPILRLGSRGEAVKELQRLLKTAGVYTGSADGIFGAQTQAAVIKFQQTKKLGVDGVVGAKTWAALHG